MMLGGAEVLPLPALKTLIFDAAGARRAAHDHLVMSAHLDSGLAESLADTVLVYGRPQSELDLASVVALRQAATKIFWVPASEDGGAAERAQALSDHLQCYGGTAENRALIFASLKAGGLVLSAAVDRERDERVGKMVALADLLVFGCDEEVRRMARRQSLRRSHIAVCPLAILPLNRPLSFSAQAPLIRAGSASAFLVQEALGDAAAEILDLDSFWEQELPAASALLIGADAVLDPRYLSIAARQIPIIADVESLFLDYLGPSLQLISFQEPAELRAEVMARRLSWEPTASWDFAQHFSVAAAARSLVGALGRLPRRP